MSLLRSLVGDSGLRRIPGATRTNRLIVGARMANLCVRRYEHFDRRIIRPLRGLPEARNPVQLCSIPLLSDILNCGSSILRGTAKSATLLCCRHVCVVGGAVNSTDAESHSSGGIKLWPTY